MSTFIIKERLITKEHRIGVSECKIGGHIKLGDLPWQWSFMDEQELTIV